VWLPHLPPRPSHLQDRAQEVEDQNVLVGGQGRRLNCRREKLRQWEELLQQATPKLTPREDMGKNKV